MVDDIPLRKAVDTVWSLYRASHRDIDEADSRRCLLERHLKGRWEARVGEHSHGGFGLAAWGFWWVWRDADGGSGV